MASGIFTQMFPPKPQWSIDEIPDLTGKVALITGGSGGIGKETARVLLTKNATVYIAARSAAKTEECIKDLKEQTGKEAHFVQIDLGDLPTIKKGAEGFLAKESKLDYLFNNGGVMFPPHEMLTPSGYDLQFGTNVVGHFYLTKLVLPALLEAAKSSPDGQARVLNTSSQGHQFPPKGGFVFDSFKDGPARKKLSSTQLYSQSKFGNIVMSNELVRRYASQGLVSVAVHPGNIKTDLQRHTGKVFNTLTEWSLAPPAFGALSQLYAATMPIAVGEKGDPKVGLVNGGYLIPWARVGKPLPAAEDKELGGKLWDWLEGEVKDV